MRQLEQARSLLNGVLALAQRRCARPPHDPATLDDEIPFLGVLLKRVKPPQETGFLS